MSTVPDHYETLKRFLRLESTGGIILFAAAILAMLFKNSPAASWYADFLTLPVQVRAGDLDLNKPLVLWVNDGLMAVFFLLVGLEIKREVLAGHLAKLSSIVLPGIAALGGMLIPASIYVIANWGDPLSMNGWAIPTATDIAFSLGVLALFAARVPIALKIFLMTLAVLDDLGAIIVIALFYSGSLSWESLIAAMVLTIGLFTLNRIGVRRLAPYIWLGIFLWISVLKSGVHATLAGVILAFAIPLGDEDKPQESLLRFMIHELHPWVAFGILPLFAFLNAGIILADFNPSRLFNTVPIGIALGLMIGKPLGVVGFTWMAVRLGWASLPENVTWSHIVGVGFLCGIGFTMSLFLGSLAFQEAGIGYARADRIGIVLGSLVAGGIGYFILSRSLPRH